MVSSFNGAEKRPSSSSDNTSDEKHDVAINISAPPPTAASKKNKDLAVETKADDSTPALQPVSFFSLFRFSTRLEIFLDIIGIFCAVAAGATQVTSQAHKLMRVVRPLCLTTYSQLPQLSS